MLTRALLGGLPEADARVLTFSTLVVADLGLILANRDVSGVTLAGLRSFNPSLWLVIAGAVALLTVSLSTPAVRELFSFGDLHLDDVAVIVVASVAALLWLAVLRSVRGWRGHTWAAHTPAHPQAAPGKRLRAQLTRDKPRTFSKTRVCVLDHEQLAAVTVGWQCRAALRLSHGVGQCYPRMSGIAAALRGC